MNSSMFRFNEIKQTTDRFFLSNRIEPYRSQLKEIESKRNRIHVSISTSRSIDIQEHRYFH